MIRQRQNISRSPRATTADFQRRRLNEGGRVGVINLGCARNLVDSQAILGRLKKSGHRIVDIDEADIAIVNTCSFIEEAKKESIDTILELLELKRQGRLRKVIVAGCLAQRYGRELAAELGEIDAVIGTPRYAKDGQTDQVYLTPAHFAYVKICESCYNRCSFCAIPGIKGKFTSRTVESVVEEVRRLNDRGVREINLIGQDITAYGMDIYREMSLARLLKTLVPVAGNVAWLRLLYAFPAHVTDELIAVMADEPQVCRYIDLPLQHISDPILKAMNRNITTAETHRLLEKLRTRIPGGSLRTTFIVGFPGETEAHFKELLDFVKEFRFEKAGVFVYSHEDGTPAYDLSGQVPEKVKRERMHRLMEVQKDISARIQQGYVGRVLKVLIDEKDRARNDVYLGRSEFDSPDVDGLVYVQSPQTLSPGDVVDVEITDAYEYDLSGRVLPAAGRAGEQGGRRT